LNNLIYASIKPGIVRAFLVAAAVITLFIYTDAAVFQIEAPGFNIIQLKQDLQYHHDRIAEILAIEYNDTVHVVIANSIQRFNRALSAEFPDWGAAAAIKSKNLIVIKSPMHFKVGKSLNELLGHELGHLMLGRAAENRWLPRWFEEGFCQLVSGEWRLTNDIRITRAVWGSGLIPLKALEHVNQFGGAKASLAYAQSYLAVSSLVQELGIEFIPDFLEKYRESSDVYSAFLNATGYKYTEWDDVWQKKTSKKYKLVLFVFESSFFFPALAILFILLYIMKRYQVWKKKKRWELEEKYKGYDQQDSSA